MCRQTLLGPTYGTPLRRYVLIGAELEECSQKSLSKWQSVYGLNILSAVHRIISLPSYEDRPTRYLAYITLDKVGMLKVKNELSELACCLVLSLCQYFSVLGPVARSLVSANHWFRSVETYTFLLLSG